MTPSPSEPCISDRNSAITVAPGTAGRPSAISTGRLPGRVEDQEVLAPFPDPLLGKLGFEVEFGERQPRKARMGAERVMEQGEHPALRIMRSMPRIML